MKNDFWVNEWLVQPQLNTIASNGTAVRIEPKVMEVLVHLAMNAGQVVSKESLIETIWADRFVTDEVITTSIFELRKALGDKAKTPRFIQTIPKRGYRLIAPVVFESEATTQESNQLEGEQIQINFQSESSARAVTNSHRLWKPAAAAIIIVLAIGLVVLKLTVWPSERTDNSSAETISNVADENARPPSAEVIEAYNAGREFWNKRSEQALKTAIEHFERAIRLDPAYAPAYAGLADSYIMLGAQNYLRPEESGPKAKAAAQMALQLDDNLAEAHASMAFVKISYDWDWSGAEQQFKRAIALDPNYALTHNWYSQYLLAAGRKDESLKEIKVARELDPESTGIRMTAGAIYFRLHQYDEAIEEFRRVIEIDPNNAAAFKSLGHAYEKKSMFKEADQAYKKAAELSGLPPIKRFSQEFAQWSKKNNAEFLLDKMSFMLKQRYVRPSYIAGLYSRFGEKDRAFDWLERAYRERDANLLFLKTDDTWDSLRADPRFFSLEQRVVPAL